MATCKHVELRQGRKGNARIDRNTTGQLIDEYLVYFSDNTATQIDAMNADSGTHGAVPLMFATSGEWVVTQKEVEQTEDDPTQWKVTVTYTLPIPGVEPAPSDPTGQRWAIEININTIAYEYEIQQNVFGSQIVNTAGDPIENVTVPRYSEELTISFTADVIDWSGVDLSFGTLGRGSTNSVAVTMTINGQSRTFAIGTLLFQNFSFSIVQDPTAVNYPRVTYRLSWRADGWDRVLANKGVNGLVASSGAKFPLIDARGNQVSSPVYLATNTSNSNVTAAVIGATVETVTYTVFQATDLGTNLLWDINT